MPSFGPLALFAPLAGAKDLSVDYGAAYASPSYPGWESELADVRSVFGTMNGPVPVATERGSDTPVEEDAAGYAASFAELGSSTGWVRFNALGCEARISLSCIFSNWPMTHEALESADIETLAADSSSYNFSGIEKVVGAAAAAGRHVDFRLGDCGIVAGTYGEDYPAFGFPTDYNSSRGVALFAAVATEVAAKVHEVVLAQRRSTSQRLLFDLFTETSEEGGKFWPGTAQTYATFFGATMNAVKARLEALPGSRRIADVQYVGANTAYGGANAEPGKRAYFSAFLEACAAMGRSACPLDIVAFHPFTTSVKKFLEQYDFADGEVQTYFGPDSGWASPPRLAITAWGLHGSGLYDMNHEVEGAAYVGQLLAAQQSLPLLFSIYYKFDGVNCVNAKSPCLVTAESGALKPNAMPFVLHSMLAATGTQRLAATLGHGTDASRGYNVVAVNGSDAAAPAVSAFVAGSSDANGGVSPARLQVSNWPCDKTTLTMVTAADSDAKTGASPPLTTVQKVGRVRGDGFFHEHGNSTPFGPLPLSGSGIAGDAYAALVTLQCGDTTDAGDEQQVAASLGAGVFV